MTTPTPPPIQRYDLECITAMGQHDRVMAKDQDGRFVLHSDHLAAMAAKDAEIARLRADAMTWKVYRLLLKSRVEATL